jgi:hypothetical protein
LATSNTHSYYAELVSLSQKFGIDHARRFDGLDIAPAQENAGIHAVELCDHCDFSSCNFKMQMNLLRLQIYASQTNLEGKANESK